MEKGLVSCVIPTYKRSDMLLRAIESVLQQSYPNVEVLVVDDNEKDDEYSLATKKKVSTVADSRLRYIQQERHINGAVARNVGIKAARGEFIAFLDDDDEWHPEKLEKQVSFLNSHPDVDGVSCLYKVCRNGSVVRICAPYTGDNLHRKVLDRTVSVFTTTILLRKTALDEAGYFDESLLRHQDLQLLLDFLYEHKMEVVGETMATLHADSEINHPDVERMIGIKRAFFEKCQRHLCKYPKAEQRDILAAHYFEIVVAAIKANRPVLAFKYLGKIGFNPKAYRSVVQRYKSR